MKRLALIAVLMLLSSPASSDFTGNYLSEAFDKCGALTESSVSSNEWCSFIVGYFTAAYDYQTIWRMTCLPDQVSVIQLAKVTEKWLKEHPEELHNTRRYIVDKAIEEAFPCEDE